MARQSRDLTLTIARLFPVAPPVVFRAFDTPGELAQWWGPEGFTVPSLNFNPCVGDIRTTLAEMASAMNYKTPQGASDGQGFELRTYAQNVGPETGQKSPTQSQYPCTGTGSP